jgi:hypothetical protein
VLGNDAHHGEGHAIEPNLSADDCGIRGKPVAPEPFTQHDRIDRLRVVGGKKGSARNWFDSEDVEQTARDPLSGNPFRGPVRASHHHAAHAIDESSQFLECASAVVPIEHVQRRDRAAKHRVASFPGNHQPFRFGQRQRAKQRRIDQGEDRAVGPDAKREGDRRDEGEPRRRLELPHRESHIVPQLFEPLCQSHLSISLSAKIYTGPFELTRITNPREHHLARDPRVHSLLDQLASPHLDMERDLFIDLSGDVDTPKPRPE